MSIILQLTRIYHAVDQSNFYAQILGLVINWCSNEYGPVIYVGQ